MSRVLWPFALYSILLVQAAQVQSGGRAVVFGNGVWADDQEQSDSLSELTHQIRNEEGELTDEAFSQRYRFYIAANQTSCVPGDGFGPDLGCLFDLYESAVQFAATTGTTFDDSTFWRLLFGVGTDEAALDLLISLLSNFDPLTITSLDIDNQVTTYRALVHLHRKIVVVPHSQGNYFIRAAISKLDATDSQSIGVVAVATPDSSVPGDGPYHTKFLDFIALVPDALPANTANEACLTPWTCHKFVDSYMQGLTGASIARDVVARFDALVDPSPLEAGFTRITDMTAPRQYHCSVQLQNGRVLLAGGWGPNRIPLNSAELYDPATRTFTPTGSMNVGRGRGSACTLLDDGRVLVAGGEVSRFVYTRTAEIYNPATGSFSTVGNMTTARGERWYAIAAPGGALLFGGTFEGNFGTATPAVDRFNASTGTFTRVGTLAGARRDYALAKLSDSSVLLVGGVLRFDLIATPLAERYNTATNQAVTTGPLNGIARVRSWGSVPLPGAQAFVVSGAGFPAETYTSASNSFAPVPSSPAFYALDYGDALTLADGQVLMLGYGRSPGEGGRLAEIFDPIAGTFSPIGAFAVPGTCEGHVATPLSDGTVLITGGGIPPSCDSQPIAEIFRP